jgi:DNA topoisomerase II
MSQRSEPKITKFNGSSDYTMISFIPDLSRFHMEKLDDDIISLMTKRVYDMAGITPKKVKVYMNGKRVEVKDFKTYVELYFKNKEMQDEKLEIIYEKNGERWEVLATLSDGDFNQVSFVNSICTTLGGTHVNYLVDQIATYIQAVLKKRHKKEVKANQIKCKLGI